MGQPARLKEDLLTDVIKSFTKMGLGGSRPHCSPRQNPPPIDLVEDELARDSGLVGGLILGSSSPTPSRNPTSGPELIPALISAPVPAPTPALVASNKSFKKFIKAYFETNQGLRQPECKWTIQAKVPEEYYGKSHMNCYHFCQQCKDHFETVGLPGSIGLSLQHFFSVETLVCTGHSSNVETEVGN